MCKYLLSGTLHSGHIPMDGGYSLDAPPTVPCGTHQADSVVGNLVQGKIIPASAHFCRSDYAGECVNLSVSCLCAAYAVSA